jgi:AraC-like DNA-binding protein
MLQSSPHPSPEIGFPSSPGLAALAALAGYADQPHLTRECRTLTGCTPAALAGYPVTTA